MRDFTVPPDGRDDELTSIFRIARLAITFAESPETVGVFAAWVRKGHEEMRANAGLGPCTDDRCAFHYSPERWAKLLADVRGSVVDLTRLWVNGQYGKGN